MSDNQNPETNQPADELDDEQLNEIAGGGGPQQGILPYIEQDNVYRAAGGQNQPANDGQLESFPLTYQKIEIEK